MTKTTHLCTSAPKTLPVVKQEFPNNKENNLVNKIRVFTQWKRFPGEVKFISIDPIFGPEKLYKSALKSRPQQTLPGNASEQITGRHNTHPHPPLPTLTDRQSQTWASIFQLPNTTGKVKTSEHLSTTKYDNYNTRPTRYQLRNTKHEILPTSPPHYYSNTATWHSLTLLQDATITKNLLEIHFILFTFLFSNTIIET